MMCSHIKSNVFTVPATKLSRVNGSGLVSPVSDKSLYKHPRPDCSSHDHGVCNSELPFVQRALQHLEGHVSPLFPSARVPDSRNEAFCGGSAPGGVCCLRRGLRHHLYVVVVDSPSSQQEVLAAEANRQPRPRRRARLLNGSSARFEHGNRFGLLA